jgi:zinc/manganese transport system substrate-binding protein
MHGSAARCLVLATAMLLVGGCAGSGTGSVSGGQSAAAPSTPGPTAVATPARTSEPIAVVASTNVYGDIVSRIGGDRVAVTSIISDPGQDPHSYEANARTQLALSQARIVVENGGGYDDFVGRMLGTAGGAAGRQLLDAVEISGHKAAADGSLNEHVWYDLGAVSVLAARIADALAAADPAGAETFRSNADAFRATLAVLQSREADLRSGHEGAEVAITEPVPLYLLQACGLHNVTPPEFSKAIEEGTDVPARVLADTLALMDGGKVKALVYNTQTAGPQTEQLRKAAEAKGVHVVGVSETLPPGTGYLDWMSHTLDAVRDALS